MSPAYTHDVVRVRIRTNYNWGSLCVLLGLSLAGLFTTHALAQDESGACPCFDAQEVEALFLNAERLGEGSGSMSCHAKDYSVECSAEVMVMDANYRTVAQATLKWADFDPSRCRYIDKSVDPPVDRNVSWPHPAPEDTARACFDIIARVIAELDPDGKCTIYP